jgi:hypothetical protein
MKSISLSLIFVLLLSGCASINSLSVTPIPVNRSNKISAEASRWIILGLNFDNDYADEVAHNLSSKCPNGKITGILTKDEDYFYFLFLVFKKQITATGYCENYAKVAGTPKLRHESNPAPTAVAAPVAPTAVLTPATMPAPASVPASTDVPTVDPKLEPKTETPQ